MTVPRSPIHSLHTISEILSQPAVWQRILADTSATGAYRDFLASTTSQHLIFVGCGTSFYLAEAAASIWTMVAGTRARAVPASEVLLFPEALQVDASSAHAVVVSRSGETSEAVRAAEALTNLGIPILAVTCVPGSTLTRICESTIAIPLADERSLVMTRSFSSMLLVLTQLAAARAARHEYSAPFLEIISRIASEIGAYKDRVESFVAAHSFEDYIYLGQGPFFSIAREGCLKVTEMSCSYAQAYHTLEFRHGPKAVVGPHTCLTFFLSESGMEAESEVLNEMKGLGGIVVGVCNRAPESVRRSCDLLVEFGVTAPDPVLAGASIVPAQLLAFHVALKKGLNPDEPKNLSRVVILD